MNKKFFFVPTIAVTVGKDKFVEYVIGNQRGRWDITGEVTGEDIREYITGHITEVYGIPSDYFEIELVSVLRREDIENAFMGVQGPDVTKGWSAGDYDDSEAYVDEEGLTYTWPEV
jgi:hypothetical protein